MKFPNNEQEAAEGQVMKIYKESFPMLERLFEWSYINHLAWSLALIFLGVIFWMSLALGALPPPPPAHSGCSHLPTRKSVCRRRVYRQSPS